MVASLAMYDWPQLRTAHQAFWSGIHVALGRRGVKSPAGLTENGQGLAFWAQPQLVFSQTCGLPYRRHLHDKVRLVGTADYAVENCAPGYYCSYFVIRRDESRNALADYENAVFAFNDAGSQSGYSAARHHTLARDFWFRKTRRTGGHLASAEAVARGKADIAAIDAVSWRMIERFEAFAPDLRILEATDPTPGLPYITGAGLDPDTVFEAVRDAIDRLDPATLADLTLRRIVRIPKQEYLKVPTP